MQWGEGDVVPAFEAVQAYGIAAQELVLKQRLEIWAHREVLVTFSSDHIQVGNAMPEHEPAWVVMVAGLKRQPPAGAPDPLASVAVGAGAILQVLVHGRTGEIVLGTAVPVALQRREQGEV
jgi:hypothetical protein